MNTSYLLPFLVIAFMILSSVVCILIVTIENSKAVKNYYRTNQISDIPDGPEPEFFSMEVQEELVTAQLLTPISGAYNTRRYSIAS